MTLIDAILSIEFFAGVMAGIALTDTTKLLYRRLLERVISRVEQ